MGNWKIGKQLEKSGEIRKNKIEINTNYGLNGWTEGCVRGPQLLDNCVFFGALAPILAGLQKADTWRMSFAIAVQGALALGAIWTGYYDKYYLAISICIGLIIFTKVIIGWRIW